MEKNHIRGGRDEHKRKTIAGKDVFNWMAILFSASMLFTLPSASMDELPSGVNSTLVPTTLPSDTPSSANTSNVQDDVFIDVFIQDMKTRLEEKDHLRNPTLLSLSPPAASNSVNYRASAEFNRNYGLAAIGADLAYQRNYYGQGVTVAVVGTGVLVTHSDLVGNIVSGYYFIEGNTVVSEVKGKGTFIAGIIGAVRNGYGTQGVAPLAKILPTHRVRYGRHHNYAGSRFNEVFLAASRNVQIINNSYGKNQRRVVGTYQGSTVTLLAAPYTAAQLAQNIGYQAEANDYSNLISPRDLVMVWAAGNDGFNSETGKLRYIDVNHPAVRMQARTSDFIRDFIPTDALIRYTTANLPSAESLIPIYKGALRDKWVAVVATNKSGRIAAYSNACGLAKYWCLAAPGSGIYSTSKRGVGYHKGRSTAFSAAHVSGALAVLKSRFPDMPMNAVLALLFATATDKGEAGIDEVYGHGLLNLGAAATVQGVMRVAGEAKILPYSGISGFGWNTRASLIYRESLQSGGNLFSVLLSPPATSNGFNYRADAEFNRNYGLAAIGADLAYQRNYFGQGVTVAVVNNGVFVQQADLAANIVPGYNFIENNNFVTGGYGYYGTHFARIIGGARNGRFMHGVAPSVKIMPMQVGMSINQYLKGVSLAASRNVQIINNNLDVFQPIAGTYQGKLVTMLKAPLTAMQMLRSSVIQADANNYANIMSRRDLVVVWVAGSGGFNSETGKVTYRINPTVTSRTRTSDFIRNFTPTNASIRFTTANQLNAHAALPIYQRALRDKWVAVVATDKSDRIADYSNACGVAKYWCLAAPGTDLDTFGESRSYKGIGTPFSAAHVSGALAVLKSRFPDMPMDAVLALLFATATDKGEVGIDEVYGHGLLNLGAAATVQGAMVVAGEAKEKALPYVRMSVIGGENIQAALFYRESLRSGGDLFSVLLSPPATSNGFNYRADAEFNRNYGLAAIGADLAYQRNYFGQGVTVAVVNNGVFVQQANLAANIVPGYNFIENNNFVTGGYGYYGTHFARIIGGVRNGRFMHGVAPSVKIMPMQVGMSINQYLKGVSLAASRNVQIINNNLDVFQPIAGTYQGKLVTMLKAPLTAMQMLRSSVIQADVNNYANIMSRRDLVVVWVAGSGGFNSETGKVTYRINPTVTSRTRTSDFIRNFTPTNASIHFTTANQLNAHAALPIYQRALRDKWVAVVATDKSDRIADYSNACGVAKYWCLAAPGTDLDTFGESRSYKGIGTPFSAAHVSGALAVLKSRFPDMPMDAVLALLFATATDKGEVGIDEVYGHGLLNLGAAVTVQGAMVVAGEAKEKALPYVRMSVIGGENIQAALFYRESLRSGGDLFSVSLSPPATSNGFNYRADAEFNRNYGLAAIGADLAYQRNYFGQGVTVAVVDTGVSVQHADLAANIVPGYNFIANNTVITDNSGHGTFVAGIIGAIRNGNGIQGVAPSVKIMPMIAGANSNSSFKSVSLAASRNVQIINNSYGPDQSMVGMYKSDIITLLDLPYILPATRIAFQNKAKDYADIIGERDIVMVWAAGNAGFNSETGEVTYRNDLAEVKRVRTSDFIHAFIPSDPLAIRFTTANQPNPYQLMPMYQHALRGKWVAVVATNKNNRIAHYSNGCGMSKYWCLAAPGSDIYSTNSIGGYSKSRGTSYSAPHVSGALAVLKSRFPDMPMNAVLALLFATATDKGAAGVDEVYGHGLLNLGAAATVQGWMTVPVPNPTATAAPDTTSGVSGSSTDSLLSRSNVRLPAALAGLRNQLEGASLAVSYLGGQYYYDMPLKNLVRASAAATLPVLGRAAAHMTEGVSVYGGNGGFSALINADGIIQQASWENRQMRLRWYVCGGCEASTWQQYGAARRRPFFTDAQQGWDAAWKISDRWEAFAAAGFDKQVDDAKYRQWGLRWRKEGLRGWDLSSAFSRIDEQETFMGGEYNGAFAVSGARTYQGVVHGRRRLSEQWSGYGGVEYGWSDVNGRANSIIQGSSGVRFYGWRVGMEGRSLWHGDDKMRFGIRRLPSIHTGDIRMRYGVSTAPTLVKRFQLDLPTGYHMVSNDFALRGDNAILLQWGYLFSPREGMEAAFGLEHVRSERYRDNSAVSLNFIWKL